MIFCVFVFVCIKKQRVVLLWTLTPAERDAYLANEATKRFTSSNWVLMEIACSRSSHELFAVKLAYHARYKKSLEEDVAHHTTGDYRKVLDYRIYFLFHLDRKKSIHFFALQLSLYCACNP